MSRAIQREIDVWTAVCQWRIVELVETSVFTRQRGKRGGARVIYYFAVERDLILLLYAYAKNEAENLTPKQVIELARVVKKEFANEAKAFEELLSSIREGGAILCGAKKPSRRFEISSVGVRAIRERTSLSQSEFADLIGVSVKTLQNWEQDRRRPTGPAAALLRIIAYKPQFAARAIHGV